MAATLITVTETVYNPDGTMASGYVEFLPTSEMWETGWGTIAPVVRSFALVNGVLTAPLWANNDSATEPTGQAYQVTEYYGAQAGVPSADPYYVIVPYNATGGTVELNTLTRVTASSIPFFSGGGSVTDEQFVRQQRIDQMATPALAWAAGSQRITNAAVGLYATDVASLQNILNGWVYDTNTWVYAAGGDGTSVGASFTITYGSNALATAGAANYPKGMRLQWQDLNGGSTATTKYGVVASTSVTGSVLTVTMGITSDYTMDNSLVANSFQTALAAQPLGFPHRFLWTPQMTGFSSAPIDSLSWWSVINGMCIINVAFLLAGTSNSTGMTVGLPIGSGSLPSLVAVPALGLDNSTSSTTGSTPASVSIGSSASIATAYKSSGLNAVAASWTASNSKSIAFQAIYPI